MHDRANEFVGELLRELELQLELRPVLGRFDALAPTASRGSWHGSMLSPDATRQSALMGNSVALAQRGRVLRSEGSPLQTRQHGWLLQDPTEFLCYGQGKCTKM